MTEQVLTYQVSELPDPRYPQYQAMARGDVLSCACSDIEQLLRAVVNLPAGSTSVAIRFVFTPRPTLAEAQSRLAIYVICRAQNETIGDCLRVLFENGPLTKYYRLQPTEELRAPSKSLQAGCRLCRREDAVDPLHTSEFNNRIPSYYYTVRLLEPNAHNDYSDLDRTLGGVKSNAIIDVCVEPTDMSPELKAHTRYLSRLQSINRVWDVDEDESFEMTDYFMSGQDWATMGNQGLKPLRYRDPLADDILRCQQHFHESLRQPHLLFHIMVLAETAAVAHLIGSVVAESAFQNGSYRLLAFGKDAQLFDEAIQSLKVTRVSWSSIHEFIFPGRDVAPYLELARLSHTATVDELAGAFRLPVAASESPSCIRKNTDPPYEEVSDLLVAGFDQEGSHVGRGPRTRGMCKHMTGTGASGFGKTTNIWNIALQLFKNNIPFLIIEPVKTEYRILKTLRNEEDKNARGLAKALELYTPGDERISPFRLNRLSPQPGMSLEEHIENTLACFLAAMPVSGPLPALLREALERVYEEYPDPDNPPIIADLVASTEKVLAEKAYSPETSSDIRAALEVRIGILTHGNVGKIFQCRKSIPSIDHLMKVPAIVELDRLHPEWSCLLTFFLLTGIREYLRTVPKADNEPRYVIIIEEAHNIVGRTSQAAVSPDVADPRAFASEYVCRMLAELRALGVGIVIVDTLPSAVAPEVIKNTTTKIAFRQVAKEDREELGASMLLNELEMEEMARLNVGEAFIFTEGYHRPRRIRTVNLYEQFDFTTDTMNENILPYVQDDAWFCQAESERLISELTQLREDMDHFDDQRFEIAKDLAILLARFPALLAQTAGDKNPTVMEQLKHETHGLRRRLLFSYRSFLRRSYKKYLVPAGLCERQAPTVREMREHLVDRFESFVKKDIQEVLGILGTFLRRLETSML
ncbi:MAG: ATP-binding protein [Thermodesulfobacteriota bacterium]|nr:ATP-binding protein [Thermodesulfobacteriota bacterium]